MNLIRVTAILCLLMTAAQGLTYFTHTFNGVTTNQPYYNLGFINGETTISVNLTTPDATNQDFTTLTIEVISTATGATALAEATTDGCGGSETFCHKTYLVPAADAGTYILTLIDTDFPANDQGATPNAFKFYYLDVTSFLTSSNGPTNSSAVITTLVKATEVLRDRVTRLIYVGSSNQELRFSMVPVPSDGGGTPAADTTVANLHLFAVSASQPTDAGSRYAIGGNDLLAVGEGHFVTTENPWTTANLRLTYNMNPPTTNPLPIGFYVLTTTYTETATVAISFDSDPYSCPFSSNYPDFFGNFQPCNRTIENSAGFPCTNFDTANSRCLACFTGYDLVNGTCRYNDTCPDRQYFDFGTCLPVADACLTFDIFTGACLTCKVNASTITNGTCTEIPVVCADRQFIDANNTCQNVSALCVTWDNATGLCTSCQTGLTLQTDGTCVETPVVCEAGQVKVGKLCVIVPKECVSFNTATLRCDKCIKGWWPSSLGVCQQIICPEMEVPSDFGFFCIKVSPLCATYDNITGDCRTCKNRDATVVAGKCLQIVNPLAGCRERERLGYGPCANALLNCELYDLISQNCQRCVAGFFTDFKGECSLKDAVCEADEVSIMGYCVQRPDNCAQVDSVGLCSQCNPTFTNVFGLCIKVSTCEANQYKGASGVCLDVTPGCKFFDPTSGFCFTCADGSDSVGGLCCPSGQHSFNGQCISADAWRQIKALGDSATVPTCLATHPTLKYCMECNGDFSPSPIQPQICI